MSPGEFRSRMEFLETVDYSVGTARRHFVCSNSIGIVSACVLNYYLSSQPEKKVITISMSESFNDIVLNIEITLLPGQVHGNEGCAGDDMSSFSCIVLCESV